MRKDIQALLDETKEKKYSKLTDKQLSQFEEFVKKGGKTKSRKKTKHLKQLAKTHSPLQGKKNVESGHLKSIASDGGKRGSKIQMQKGLGIHTKDEKLRKEWSRLGGLAVIDKLNEYKVCPYCKIKTRGAAYNRWHGNNCKLKK